MGTTDRQFKLRPNREQFTEELDSRIELLSDPDGPPNLAVTTLHAMAKTTLDCAFGFTDSPNPTVLALAVRESEERIFRDFDGSLLPGVNFLGDAVCEQFGAVVLGAAHEVFGPDYVHSVEVDMNLPTGLLMLSQFLS